MYRSIIIILEFFNSSCQTLRFLINIIKILWFLSQVFLGRILYMHVHLFTQEDMLYRNDVEDFHPTENELVYVWHFCLILEHWNNIAGSSRLLDMNTLNPNTVSCIGVPIPYIANTYTTCLLSKSSSTSVRSRRHCFIEELQLRIHDELFLFIY